MTTTNVESEYQVNNRHNMTMDEDWDDVFTFAVAQNTQVYENLTVKLGDSRLACPRRSKEDPIERHLNRLLFSQLALPAMLVR